jgi:hypothetical protein
MRMDIEISPGARGQRYGAAAREYDGLAFRGGRMNEKRLCSMSHPENIRRERAGRFLSERTMGVLWRHSNVNLVKPRSIALAAAASPARSRRSRRRLASAIRHRNWRIFTMDNVAWTTGGRFAFSTFA